MRYILMAAGIAALADPVLAESCPTAADLETGIRLSKAGAALTKEIRFGDGVVNARLEAKVGGVPITSQETGPHGLAVSHLVLLRDGVPASEIETQFLDDLSGLDRLHEVGLVQSRVSARVNGSPALEDGMTWLFWTQVDVALGDCRYDGIEIDRQATAGGKIASRSVLTYVPELMAVVDQVDYGLTGAEAGRISFDTVEAIR